MKLTMTRVLTPLAALAFTLGAQASDYAKDDFEGQWSNSTGGYSFTPGPDAAADATAQYTYDGDAPAAALSPIGGATNLKGLKLSTEDGILFRNLTGANIGDGGLYVDTDVQFTLTDKSDRPAATADDKFIIWLEVDDTAVPATTNLCVWAREYAFVNGALDYTAGSNKVYTLDASAVVPGSWHRLTVKAIKQSHTTDVPVPGFQVYLDNTLLTSSQQQIVPDDDYNDARAAVETAGTPLLDLISGDLKFFPAMSSSLATLAQVGFSGEGKIDDFVVSDNIPSSLPRVAINVSFPSAVGCATLMGVDYTNSPAFLTLEPGQSFSFSMDDLLDANYQPLSSYSFKLNDGALGNEWAIDGNIEGSYDDTKGTVTITALSASVDTASFTIALENSNSATLTLDLTGIDDYVEKIDTVSYVVGDVTNTFSNAQLNDTLEINNLELNNVVTLLVNLLPNVGGVPVFTPDSGVTGSGSTFTISENSAYVFITLAEPVATVDGVSYATFAEAFAAAKTAGEPVVLCDDITLDEAQAVAANEAVTIDLNGCTITGPAGDAAFENAGTLTITDESQDHDGSVVAGASGSVVYNEGTLALVYGYYEGDFVNTEETFTITTDCTFDNDLGRSYTAPAGYEMAETYEGSGVYQLKLLTYTITYYNGDQLLDVAPASYTVEDTVTLTNEVDLGVVGVSFQAWTNAEGTVVAGWPAGGLTGNQVFYAQTTPVVAPTTEYTITYLNSDGSTFTAWATGYTAPASFSNEVVNLPTSANIDFGVVGVQFNNWTNSEGTVVSDTTGLEANLTVYANVSALVPPSGTEPGAAVDGSPFASAEAAAAAANSATFKVPDAVAAELTSEQQSAYATLFHAKVGEPVDGQYPVTMELTGEGAATIQSSADLAVAALATNLTAAATAAQQVTVAAQPGFYYSIEAGAEVNNLAEPQQRTLATGDTVTLTMPTLGTKGFYRVKVSYEQLPPAPNN